MNIVHVITGEQGSGKTTAVINLAQRASQSGQQIAGIAAPVVYQNGKRVGYDLLDLRTGIRAPWMRTTSDSADIGNFRIQAEGKKLAEEALDRSRLSPDGFVFIDEIGPLELDGRGHAWSIVPLLDSDIGFLIVTARPTVAERISRHWRCETVILTTQACSNFGDSLF